MLISNNLEYQPRGRIATLLATVLLLSASPVAVQAADDPKPAKKRKVFNIVVDGRPYTGYLNPPATDTGFEFEMKDTKEKVFIRWSTLTKYQRSRFRKHFGLPEEGADKKKTWGKDVHVTRFTLKSNKTVEGIEMPERARPGHRCLQLSKMLVQIPKGDIVSEETIKKSESEILSPMEVYDRMLVEDPPAADSANDHIKFARKLLEMSLYEKALDHLAMANTIDARTEPRTKELRDKIATKLNEHRGKELYNEILRDLNRRDFANALAKLDRLSRNFPGHPLLSKLEARRPEMERNKEKNFKKYVVNMYYKLSVDLIRKRMSERMKIDDKGRPVPAIPGKQVTTRNGLTYRGPLVEESEEGVTITQKGAEVVIKRQDIKFMRDVDLSRGHKTVAPNFAQLQSYVSNPSAGLGKDIVTRIAQIMKADEAKVKAAWEGRRQNKTVIENGVVTTTVPLAKVHEAYYGEGSWLREGARVTGGKRLVTRNKRRKKRRTWSGNDAPPTNVTPGDKSARARELAKTSDDPEVWWSVQKPDLKYRILRAISAEKLFHVRKIVGQRCRTCNSRGVIDTIDADGQHSTKRCLTCRGLKTLTKVIFE